MALNVYVFFRVLAFSGHLIIINFKILVFTVSFTLCTQCMLQISYRCLVQVYSLPPALCSTSKSFSSFKKNLNRFCLDSHFGRDNVYIDCVEHSINSSYRIIVLNKLS